MSLFNRKTVLDDEILSLSVHGISIGIEDVLTGGFTSAPEIMGEITGSTAAAEAATEGARLSAEATLAATERNIEFQEWLWGEQKGLAEPYTTAGEAAISPYMEAISKPFTIEDLYLDPGYQFGLTEGQKAYETSGAARGMQLSGAQVKAQTRFGQDYASTKYNEAFNRRQIGLDNLYRMIAGGQAAAAGQAQTGTAMGAQVSGAITEGGRATSQMYSDIGNIQAGAAMAPWNTLMDIGSLGAQYYGAKAGAS